MTRISLTPAVGQLLGLAQHVGDRPRDEVAAQRRDDAEGAAVVAAFGNLQIGVVARRQLDALRRQQVEIGIMRRRRRLVHRRHDALIGLRSGDGEHVRVLVADHVRLGAEAAGDDDAAVLGQRVADRLQRLVAGRIEEAAGVDDDQVGAVMLARDLVALGAQPRDDALGIDERLRAAEADETDAWGGHDVCFRSSRGGGHLAQSARACNQRGACMRRTGSSGHGDAESGRYQADADRRPWRLRQVVDDGHSSMAPR